jgi:hypothetical protein
MRISEKYIIGQIMMKLGRGVAETPDGGDSRVFSVVPDLGTRTAQPLSISRPQAPMSIRATPLTKLTHAAVGHALAVDHGDTGYWSNHGDLRTRPLLEKSRLSSTQGSSPLLKL